MIRLLLLLFPVGIIFNCCSSDEALYGKRRATQNYFRSPELGQYFLPQIPNWVNVSADGQCTKKSQTQFFDLSMLGKFASLKYSQGVHLQILYNRRSETMASSLNQSNLSQEQESTLFFSTLSTVKSSRSALQIDFPAVNLIWIDSYLDNPEELRKKLNNTRFDKAFPVFLSLCLREWELEQWVLKKIEYQTSFEMLSADALTLFSPSLEKKFEFGFVLDELFGEKKSYYLFSKGKKIPSFLDQKFTKIYEL